jgi:NCS1 family nucleobase:cation symporter-1
LIFAVYGTYFVVFIRGVVACVWRCPPMFHNPTANSWVDHLWGLEPNLFREDNAFELRCRPSGNLSKNIPYHILASPHVTSAQLLGFFLIIIVIIIQLPLLWLHVSKLRYLFMAKTIVTPLSALTLFVWALVEGKIITIVHSTMTSNTLVAKGFGLTLSNDTHITDDTPAIFVFF